MSEREPQEFPDWAEEEREGDLGWIRENLHLFWPMAQLGYQEVGRGSIFVDATTSYEHPGGVGNLMAYLEQAIVEELADEDTQRLVRDYDPETQFVTTLLKAQDRLSSYRVGFAVPEALGEQEEALASETLEPPDWETLEQWADEGVCEAACPHHCLVEPDGRCEHGNPSWLLKLGLI